MMAPWHEALPLQLTSHAQSAGHASVMLWHALPAMQSMKQIRLARSQLLQPAGH